MLFSAPMVRALIAGEKTQTRRLCKSMNAWVVQDCREVRCVGADWGHFMKGDTTPIEILRCPHGSPGDLLFVRETTVRVEEHGYKGPVYAASEQGSAMLDWGIRPAPDDACDVEPEDVRRRPAIHMLRAHSRLTLRITEVRIERLQDISEADAKAEGVTFGNVTDEATGEIDRDAVEAYEALWESINGAGSWDANPWVWVVGFEVIHENVDAYIARTEYALAA